MKRLLVIVFVGITGIAIIQGDALVESIVSKEEAREAKYLPGQIIVTPGNGSSLVYNRDTNGDGELDPFYMIGPGDPEGFLYLGKRQKDGTRKGGRQEDILRRLVRLGGNGIYFQVVRSHGGDGAGDHNPWRDPGDPASGLNPDILRQWKGWFNTMRKAGIVMFLFIYDDGAHPFDDGCSGTVDKAERAFLRELVTELQSYPNLIWVVQEEFKFVGHSGKRRPCDKARVKKTGAIASLIKQYDKYDHPVGVHHNIGEGMAFPDHPTVDIYVQQADVRPDKRLGNLESLHKAGQPGRGYDVKQRYVYIMGEGYNWHPKLVAAGNRALLRKSYYATALSGGHVMVLGMFPTEEGAEPTDEMLDDMRTMQMFFEAVPYHRMVPRDDLRFGGTKWVMAEAKANRYILYTYEETERLGVRSLRTGHYTLQWFDPVSGERKIERKVKASGNTVFSKPKGFGPEVILYVAYTTAVD